MTRFLARARTEKKRSDDGICLRPRVIRALIVYPDADIKQAYGNIKQGYGTARRSRKCLRTPMENIAIAL